MKASLCLLLTLGVMVRSGLAADPAPATEQPAAPAEAPEFAKLREALKKLEGDPGAAADTFLSIYTLFQSAEQFAGAHDVPNAKSRFEAALAALQELRKRVPNWNPSIVDFRTRRVEAALAALEPARQQDAAAAEPVPGTVQRFTPAPPLPPPGLKAPPGFLEENRERAAARKWAERNFNGEKLYVVPLMAWPEVAGY